MGSIPNRAGDTAKNSLFPMRMFSTSRSISPDSSREPPISGMIPTTNAMSRTDGSAKVRERTVSISPVERVNRARTAAADVIASHRLRREM